MKRLLSGLFIVMLLVACSEIVDEDINKNMAKDTQEVLDILDTAVEDNRNIGELTENEMDVILNYIDAYVPNELDMNDTETNLLNETRDVIENMSDYLDGAKDYQEQKQNIQNILYE